MAKPHITARVYGGLGNQCFIYAAARALADRTGGQLILDPTVLALDRVYRRPYLLPEFFIRADHIVTSANLLKLHFRRLHVRLQPRLPWRSRRWLFEQNPPSYQAEIANWHGTRATLDGFWQSERYFADDAGAIAADLTPRRTREFDEHPAARQIKNAAHPAFLHVRSYREVPGKQDGSFALPMSYFQNAVACIRGQVPQAHFFLFSDAPDWVRQRLRLPDGTSCTYVTPSGDATLSPLLDFHLMTLCRHAIVANSSFSWWAGWLGEQRWRRRGTAGLILRPAGHCMNVDYFPTRWQGVERI
ncbi:MAG: alpha-1,2-fucosyltransferase [Lentisphaeria bacterium]|jgi:hypothetical protein